MTRLVVSASVYWAHLDTATAGPRTVPVRSGLSGVKTLELSRIPRPSDVLRAGTARAPVVVSRCAPNEAFRPPAVVYFVVHWANNGCNSVANRAARNCGNPQQKALSAILAIPCYPLKQTSDQKVAGSSPARRAIYHQP